MCSIKRGDFMGRKVFVSYKYKDSSVETLIGTIIPTWPSDYVKYIEENIINRENDLIYKGEGSDEDLSDKSEEYIWAHLKDKIYDSTVTVVLVSPNMKESNKWEKSQWIPWEISFSVKKTTRNNRTSQRNALLVVILPDSNGKYDYFNNLSLFRILDRNIKNGLAEVVNWEYFKINTQKCIDKAVQRLNDIDEDDIIKTV